MVRKRVLLAAAAAVTCVSASTAASLLMLAAAAAEPEPRTRAQAVGRVRSGKMQQIAYDLSDADFRKCYRMDKSCFAYVLARIKPVVEVGDNHRGDTIEADLMLSAALSWLRGGSYLDICRLHGLST
jgi:hypothetical protein